MGDISVIARRLAEDKIEFGWSGNGGTFNSVGVNILTYYNTPERVDYLFSIGQIRHLGLPILDKSGDNLTCTCPDNAPLWTTDSEVNVANKIAFTDMVYFYDLDQQWYYLDPGPVSLKIPLQLLAFLSNKFDDPYCNEVCQYLYQKLAHVMFDDYFVNTPEIQALIVEHNTTLAELKKYIDFDDYNPLYDFLEKYRWLHCALNFNYIVVPTEDMCDVDHFDIQLNKEPYVETIKRVSLDDYTKCTEFVKKITKSNWNGDIFYMILPYLRDYLISSLRDYDRTTVFTESEKEWIRTQQSIPNMIAFLGYILRTPSYYSRLLSFCDVVLKEIDSLFPYKVNEMSNDFKKLMVNTLLYRIDKDVDFAAGKVKFLSPLFLYGWSEI